LNTQLVGLLHDADEAFLIDLPSPVKQFVPEFGKLSERLRVALWTKFNLVDEAARAHDHVKAVDTEVCKAEAKHLMSTEGIGWNWQGVKDINFWPHCEPWRIVKQYFLQKYDTLQKARGIDD
jgi:hypothetical protein